MNDKELADKVVSLKIGVIDDEDLYIIGLSEDLYSADMIVRDWRIAGALMEKCFDTGLEIEISPPISEQHIAAIHVGDEMRDISKGIPVPRVRALIDCCVTALEHQERE